MGPIVESVSPHYNYEAENSRLNQGKKSNFPIVKVRNQEWPSQQTVTSEDKQADLSCLASFLKRASKESIQFYSQVDKQSVEHLEKKNSKEDFLHHGSAQNTILTIDPGYPRQIIGLDEEKPEKYNTNPFGSEDDEGFDDRISENSYCDEKDKYSLHTIVSNPFGPEDDEGFDDRASGNSPFEGKSEYSLHMISSNPFGDERDNECINYGSENDSLAVAKGVAGKANLVAGNGKQGNEIEISQKFLDELNKYVKSDIKHHRFRKNHYQKLEKRIHENEYLNKLFVCAESDKSINWREGQRPQKKEDYEKIFYAFENVSGNGKLGEKNSSHLMQVLSRFISDNVPETITAQVVNQPKVVKADKYFAKQVKSPEQISYLTELVQYILEENKQLAPDQLRALAYKLAQQKWSDEAKKLEQQTNESLKRAAQKNLKTGTDQNSFERFMTHFLHPVDYFRGHDAERQIKDFIASASSLDQTYQKVITKNTEVVSRFFEAEHQKLWGVITRQVNAGQGIKLTSDRFEEVKVQMESAFRRLGREKLKEEILWADTQFKTQIDASIRQFNPGQTQSLTDIEKWFSQFANTLDNYRLAQTAYREQLQNRLLIEEGADSDDTIIQEIINEQDKHFQQLQQSLADKLIASIEPLEVAKYQPIIQELEKLADDPTLSRVDRAEALREKVLEYKQHLNTAVAMLSRHSNLTKVMGDFRNSQAERFQRIVANAGQAFPEPLSRGQRIKQALFGEAKKPNILDRLKDILQTLSNKVFFGIGVASPLLITIGALGGVSVVVAGSSVVIAGPLLVVAGILCLAVSAVYASSKLLNDYAETGKENERISKAKVSFDRLVNGDLWDMQIKG